LNAPYAPLQGRRTVYCLQPGFFDAASCGDYSVVWSVLSIADLVNAVSLGLITAPVVPGSTMTTFPWVLVPTVGVPLALMLHGITLYRLRHTGISPST